MADKHFVVVDLRNNKVVGYIVGVDTQKRTLTRHGHDDVHRWLTQPNAVRPGNIVEPLEHYELRLGDEPVPWFDFYSNPHSNG